MLEHNAPRMLGLVISEGTMDAYWEERRLKDILFSNIEPMLKVQHLVRMGYDQTDAEEIVERYEIGQEAPVYKVNTSMAEPAYYERLDFDPEED